MPDSATYPGALSELDFVECYSQSTLRKPQVAADSALRTLVLASQGDRVLLVGLVAEQLAEAARRLVAVHDALADRTRNIARSLSAPLPGIEAWISFIQGAASCPAEEMLRRLNLNETALDAAVRLRAQPDLSSITPLVAASASLNAMILVPGLDGRRAPNELLLATGGTGTTAVALGVREEDAAMLADITADLSSIARGFLGAYLSARRGAGRRD